MSFSVNEITPWGCSFDEYTRMFDLADGDMDKTILGCADGSSSFNVEGTRRGRRITSCDPLYNLPTLELADRIRQTFEGVMGGLRANASSLIWDRFQSPEDCGRVRLEAMRDFLLDFDAGRTQRRYVSGGLPRLPFGDKAFDLALCSHFLFTYSGALTVEFHREALYELCRVAREVRIFPLLDQAGQPVPFLGMLIANLQDHGFNVSQVSVPYEFQKGADQMLRIRTA
jgi:hypothetical protein